MTIYDRDKLSTQIVEAIREARQIGLESVVVLLMKALRRLNRPK